MGTNCILIAIVGPSASGKSMLAKRLARALGRTRCAVICQDDYYKDWSHLPRHKRKQVNFDDAKAFDFRLLEKHISVLKSGKFIQKPSYCFMESKRLTKRYTLTPKRYIIVEGLMPLFDNRLRKLFDYKIYIDTNNAVCLARRIRRDTKERGESIESVCSRYFNDVLPKQKRYVEPQKRWADVVVDGNNAVGKKEASSYIISTFFA